MLTGKLARNVLRDERKKSGCTQQQIADMLGVDRSTYSYYEIGRLQVPHEVLLKLADYYKMPVSMFFTESADDLVFHSDRNAPDDYSPNASSIGADQYDPHVDASPLTFEEKRLLSLLRAKSCYSDDKAALSDLAPFEFDDDALLSYLVDPDDT